MLQRLLFMLAVMSALCGQAAHSADLHPLAAFQGGGTLNGHAPSIVGPPYQVRWTFVTSSTERAGVDGAPIISGETVYLADRKGTIHAIDLASGKTRWTCKAADGFATAPLVMGDKLLLGDLSGTFYCISSKTGEVLWTIDTQSAIHASANSDGKRILFANDGAQVYCVSPDGNIIWQAQAGDRINSAPCIAGDTVYISGCDAQLRALNLADGKEKFVADMGALAPGSPTIVDGRIIVGCDQGRVVCFDVNGRPQWTYDQIGNQAMVFATPAISDGLAIVGTRDRQIHAIDISSGQRVWAYPTRGEIDASPLISDGRAFVAGKDKTLYVLDARTGKELWTFAAGRSLDAGCAIGNGTIILADSGGTVYCLEAAK